MFRFRLSIPFAVAFALAAAFPPSLQADEARPVSTWWDPALKVRFPTKLAGLELSSRKTYGRGDLDYSLNYKPEEDGEQAVADEVLDIFVYTRPGKPTTPEGCMEEMREALRTLKRAMTSSGMSEVFVNTNFFVRVWGETGLTNAVGLCELSGGRLGKCYASVASVTAIGDRFVKLRHSIPVDGGEDAPARRFGEVCAALDRLFAAPARRAKIDVYSAEDAEKTMSLLREKWPEALERESQWLMPGWVEKVDQLNAAQRWCVQDFANRVSQFERISREGVETKTDPALWHYNLACALSVQNRIEDAVEELEQSVAAGFSGADHAAEDGDFANLRPDPRFGKLVAAMKVSEAAGPLRGVEPLRPQGGECIVGEENVSYDFGSRSYMCAIDTADKKLIMYVNKNAKHKDVPCDGLTVPSFDEEAYDEGALGDTADIMFSYDPEGKGRVLWCPTLVACAESGGDIMSSIPVTLAADGVAANVELKHEQWNVLGIYSAQGYGDDGTDPFSCWCPGHVAHAGGAEEGDKFVGLAAEIIREIPFGVIEKGFPVGQIVQKIMRASQKGVEGEQGFMSGLAMRPVLDFADIEVDRALAAAKAVDPERLQPLAPYFLSVDPSFPVTLVGDSEEGLSYVVSAHHAGFVASWAERTAVIEAKFLVAEKDCGVEWRVLAGDAGRVRFEQLDGGIERISIDYQEVFEEDLPSGRKLKSGRVDIGCFAVRDGVASIPCVLSVYFPPTERREYASDGKLKAVDYMKSGFAGRLPEACPRGDWRDEHHYGDDGVMTGWTRYRPSLGGGIVTDEFTADGLVVVTRDEQHRPKRCRRDLRSAWYQAVQSGGSAEDVAQTYEGLSADYDSREEQPCGDHATTLVWEYEYGEDGKGVPHPVEPVPFRRRPELCPAADFGAESGFELPLFVQMRIGYGMYSEYKAGRVPQAPSAAVKLKFVKSAASDKSIWPAEVDEFEQEVAKRLFELGDGVYRALANGDGKGRDRRFFAVDWTYITMNRASEYVAYGSMDSAVAPDPSGKLPLKTAFVRCDVDETLDVLSSRTNELDLAKLHVNTGRTPLGADDLPKDKSISCAMWKINDSLRFGIITDFGNRFEVRKYFFSVVGSSGEALTWDWFEEFPSRVIADTVLKAACHEPDAVNNLAVLMHAGVCNPGERSGPSVEKLLEFAAKGGCAVAAENLKAMRGGELEKSTQPPPPPELIGSMMGEYTPVCDIWDERWEMPFRERTPMRHVYCWTGAEGTVLITASVEATEGELKWKLIQGDPAKVRFTPLGNGTGSVRAEIDWHGVYLARGRDGKARRTTRVEFGCVAVKDGLESEPCIVSVSASPHATREYDESGWLRKISYLKPLLPDKVSSRFPLGDWEDVFEYSPDGQLVGWTRLRKDANGAEEKEHFTRDGLKVLSYDAIGRPLRCERDYRATIYQRTARGERGDNSDLPPVQFEYRYTGIEDYLGRARRVDSGSPVQSPSGR